MALRCTGIDPDTGRQGCPTVWMDEDKGKLVLQGGKPDEKSDAECAASGRNARRGREARGPASSGGTSRPRYPT